MKLRYVHHATWAHLNGVLDKSLPYVYMCIPLSLLGNDSLKTSLRQQTRATEELLDASSSTRSVSYQKKVADQFFPELMVFKIREVG
jgi:hypothetical protein